MKWFQHESEFHTNPKGKQIIRKYGMEGAGFWWICCELVAKDGEEYRLKAKTDWKISLQEISKFSQEKTEEILNYLSEINSIDKKSLLRGDLCIPKMREYSDDYTNRKRRMSEHTSDKVPLDKIRVDKNRLDKNRVFSPPTLKEVKEYCEERNNGIKPEHFIDFYESKGWLVGKNKMKDWKAAVRTWEQRGQSNKNQIAVL